MKSAVMLFSAVALLVAVPARAEFVLNLQGAAVFAGDNDLRIPGDDGTDISFSEELEADTAFSGRIEAGYIRNGRDYFGVVHETKLFAGYRLLEGGSNNE